MPEWMIWGLIGLVLLAAEMLSLTYYILALGLGAWFAAGIAWFYPEAWWVQIVGACVFAALLHGVMRLVLRRAKYIRRMERPDQIKSAE
jgi:membrane protein implicated in regulation of membrane protease activity